MEDCEFISDRVINGFILNLLLSLPMPDVYRKLKHNGRINEGKGYMQVRRNFARIIRVHRTD
jgi:hypothetical protein